MISLKENYKRFFGKNSLNEAVKGLKGYQKKSINEADSSTVSKMNQKMRTVEASYRNWSISANQFLDDVDTGSGEGKKLKKMIWNNRFQGANSGKKIAAVMQKLFNQAKKESVK